MSRITGLKSTNYNPKQTIKIMLKSFEGNTDVSPQTLLITCSIFPLPQGRERVQVWISDAPPS